MNREYSPRALSARETRERGRDDQLELDDLAVHGRKLHILGLTSPHPTSRTLRRVPDSSRARLRASAYDVWSRRREGRNEGELEVSASPLLALAHLVHQVILLHAHLELRYRRTSKRSEMAKMVQIGGGGLGSKTTFLLSQNAHELLLPPPSFDHVRPLPFSISRQISLRLTSKVIQAQ